MSDSSVPLSMEELEQIVEMVAHNLLEKWAIDDRFTEEEIAHYSKHCVEDTVFVINNYMEAVNQMMLNRAEAVPLTGTTPSKLELINND
jgi:hypothetical protein